ncbi:rhombosortase [Vibrio mediterranei]|uniref:rhombosortase n=1 Tax=Vibrio mediterranei TaxID=689 RepID=UPI001EFC649E|nr:rhombosortase [Vibrio mediterranei]MCG9623298.1 rhombosortase [Vibrio mediterranei]
MDTSFVIRLLLFSLLCALLQIPSFQSLVEWNKLAIHAGQWWRIVSGNFSHTNLAHLGMNLAGLWVICYVFRPSWRSVVAVTLISATSIGFTLLFTNLTYYLGLSGVLHALFAYWALQEALSGRNSSWLLVLGIIGKVAWESFYGASEATSQLIAAPVATQAHAIGLGVGLILALSVSVYRRKLQSDS